MVKNIDYIIIYVKNITLHVFKGKLAEKFNIVYNLFKYYMDISSNLNLFNNLKIFLCDNEVLTFRYLKACITLLGIQVLK
ncbi:hypothetical protein UT300019_27570 [Clostridium sp. CTA-19]